MHTETGTTPLARFAEATARRPTDQELREAFSWAVERQVSKTALVSLLGNRYEVHQALCGRRVELRFDPYCLERVAVYYAGRPFGEALVHQVSRHVHPQAQEPADQPRPQSGIDYLRLIEQEHARDWLSRRINYHQLAGDAVAGDDAGAGEQDDDDHDEGAGGAPAPVRS